MVMSEKGRRERIEKTLAAHADQDRSRSERIPWQGGWSEFPVIRLPLEAVVLRPSSHRIRAQVESSSHRELLESDPFSEEAQEILAQILREIEGFEELKGNLKADAQRHPGVITRDGVLINGNRRSVALRDLGERYIDVVVLPEDAGEQELDELEAQLQMAKDFRQEYSFVNELLFIEDRINKGRTKEQVARELGWAVSDDKEQLKRGRQEVTKYEHILSLIREMRDLSDPPVPWTTFDEHEQALKDLEQAYYALKDREPHKADALKQKRMLAILADSEYRVMRKLKDEDPATHLVPALEEEERLGDATRALVDESGSNGAEDGEDAPEGLDELGDEDEVQSAGAVDLTPMLHALAAARTRQHVEVEADDRSIKLDSEELRNMVKSAIADAAELEEVDRKQKNSLTAPRELLEDARKKARRALERFRNVNDQDGFDDGAFTDELKRLEHQVEEIRREVDGG